MPTKDQITSMKELLQFCANADHRFPQPTDKQAEAWAEILSGRGFSLPQLRAGVVEFFASDTYGRQPMPGLILDAAARAAKKRPTDESPAARAYRLAYNRWERDCRIAEAEGDLYPPQPKREDFTNESL